MSSGSRGLVALMLILLVVSMVGLWRGWWGMSVTQNEVDDEVGVHVSVDKDRVKQDADALVDETKEVAESVAVAADVETVRGTITEVSTDRLTVEVEDDTSQTFELTSAAEIVTDRDLSPQQDLQVGQMAIVTYRDHDQQRTVLKVKIIQQGSADS